MKSILALVIWIAGGLSVCAQGKEIRLLAVGDINLGRSAGQILLQDSIEYPFRLVRSVFREHSVVFANLESPITDQNGETQHPRDIYRFCAPPQAAKALRKSGVTVVSLANNHALDYDVAGLSETIDHLNMEGIAHTGASKDSTAFFAPAILERGGIRIGFLAYTEFVNQKGWEGRVSVFNSQRMRREVQALRQSVDVLVASYHGGKEYAEKPGENSLHQMKSLVDAGADIVLGHHPHVPQGIERYKGKWIFYSLGNFIFLQPQRKWALKSFAASMTIRKDSAGVSIGQILLAPLEVSNQPSFDVSESLRQSVFDRLKNLSTLPFVRKDSLLAVD